MKKGEREREREEEEMTRKRTRETVTVTGKDPTERQKAGVSCPLVASSHWRVRLHTKASIRVQQYSTQYSTHTRAAVGGVPAGAHWDQHRTRVRRRRGQEEPPLSRASALRSSLSAARWRRRAAARLPATAVFTSSGPAAAAAGQQRERCTHKCEDNGRCNPKWCERNGAG